MIPTVNPSQPVWMQRKRIGLLFALVLMVLMAGAASSVYETMNLLQANKWVVHTLEVLNALEQTYVEVRDAEAAQRGYVITGDEQFVTAFEQATEKVNAQHPILRASTSDNPTQQQNLQQLETLMAQRVKIAADVIALRQHEWFDAARAQVAAGAGTQLMASVDRTISAMKQEETQLLSQRGQAANWAAVRLLVALALPMVTTLVLLATVYWLMRRDRIQRAEAAEKFRLVVESCPPGIIMVDRFG